MRDVGPTAAETKPSVCAPGPALVAGWSWTKLRARLRCEQQAELVPGQELASTPHPSQIIRTSGQLVGFKGIYVIGLIML